jgi:hypothetical protein
MVSEPDLTIGSTLVLAGDISFYVVSGFAINSLYFNPVNRTPKSVLFLASARFLTDTWLEVAFYSLGKPQGGSR